MSTLQTTTSTTRPSAQAGETYFETDTKNIIVYDGTAWRGYDSTLANSLAAGLDGTDDYLDCGSDSGLNLTSAFTLSAWVKQSTVKDNTVLFRRTGANGYQIRLISGTFNYYGGTSDRNFTTGLNSTTDWYHLVVTHTGSSVSGYVNGSQVGSSFSESIIGVTTADFVIGRHDTAPTGSGFTRYFEGNIDEVGVWSSALTASEIAVLSNGPHYLLSDNGGYNSSSNLVAWWRMGDGSGDTDSGSGAPANGDTIGTVKNLANPGTHDGAGTNGPTYSNNVPN